MSVISRMSIDVRPGECLAIGDVLVQVVHKSGQVARLSITAPRSVRIAKNPTQSKKADNSESSAVAEFVPRMAQSTTG